MTKGKRLTQLLLLSSVLAWPVMAAAQSAPEPDAAPQGTTGNTAADDFDISVPGGTIVVTGRINRDPARNSTQVMSVLSTEQIARTGEGNIAGALSRVTGLSVVGSGMVYVRGLGDRYSLALLNGSPLPSPEPLRRVVPLDIFPTGVVSSSMVQKTYSVNYPGEFGGGVINLTTKAIPSESFLTIGGGVTYDSEATGRLGYDYYGSKTDWSGFDNGQRDIPPALAAFFASGERISGGNVNTQAIASELVNSRNALVQKYNKLPANGSASFSAGTSVDIGGTRLGVILGGGYNRRWQNRDAILQSSSSANLSIVDSDFRRVTTDQRMVVNGLLGVGAEFGPHTVRWTNLYIRDTIKSTRLGNGHKDETQVDYAQQDTAWFERQLIDTQLVGEFEPAAGLSVDVRATYANSQREAPYELSLEYVRSNVDSDPLGKHYINKLNRATGRADIAFSDLNEDLWSGGLDVSYEFAPEFVATVGGAWSDTKRTSVRRSFLFDAPSTMPAAVGALRPDMLLRPNNIRYFGIGLLEEDESSPAFAASLETLAGYAKINAAVSRSVSLDAGVRFEKGDMSVAPVQVFSTPSGSNATTAISNSYWLPAATLTWEAVPDLQLRFNASKTIARPQFRELIYQPFYDPDGNRVYLGNPLLEDSTMVNAEARAEWYFDSDQRVSVSGFFKKIDRPIEAFVTQMNGQFTTSFANAPKATLYGAELELQKSFEIEGGLWESGQRIMLIGNYTFSKSQLSVKPDDVVRVYAASSGVATDYFQDKARMTGQSDHLVNIQLGLENDERLSQQTLLLTYASDRVISRGLTGTPPQPDVIEKPGFRLDFVAREGLKIAGKDVEAKFEVRNILGQGHEEFQRTGDRRIEVNTYDVGTTVSASLSVTF